ncbi:MAG TPA: sigma-70 family RNA polymerase sigma factor [Candidatus Acetothermia bacterium]|nr:sigma-70 family RNA polymerase sigma factor [Candidatus Acetothermia bacterium]
MIALDSLPPKQRTVVVLRYFDALSYKEIAQAVGVPVGTVKSRLNHAIRKLRVSLGVDEKDELQMG